ncbi:MAG: hypothetical protein R2697_05820 [Ilumatobacteraceae bacterium]
MPTACDGDQDVVLGVWDLVFSSSAEELDAVVDGVVGAISAPYLSLFGIDPGPEYAGLAHGASCRRPRSRCGPTRGTIRT